MNPKPFETCKESMWTGPTPYEGKLDKLEILFDNVFVVSRPHAPQSETWTSSKSFARRVCGQVPRPYEGKADSLSFWCQGPTAPQKGQWTSSKSSARRVSGPVPRFYLGKVHQLEVLCEGVVFGWRHAPQRESGRARSSL